MYNIAQISNSWKLANFQLVDQITAANLLVSERKDIKILNPRSLNDLDLLNSLGLKLTAFILTSFLPLHNSNIATY